MSTTTIRIPAASHATLQELALEQGRTLGQVVNDAIERYAREQFLNGLNEDYARLQADPAAWAEWQAELISLEGTLLDGLADDPARSTPRG